MEAETEAFVGEFEIAPSFYGWVLTSVNTLCAKAAR